MCTCLEQATLWRQRTITIYGHSSCNAGCDPCRGIFDNTTDRRGDAVSARGIQKNVRSGLCPGHLSDAEQLPLETRQESGDPQSRSHLFVTATGCDKLR